MPDFRKIDAFFNGEKPFEDKTREHVTLRVRILRFLKLAMPSVAAMLVAIILLYPSLKKDNIIADLDVTLPKKGELEKLHIENTEFAITDKNNQVSTFTALRIDETAPGSKLMKIIEPSGKIATGEHDKYIRIDSQIGYFNQAENKVTVEREVKVVYDDGTTLLTEAADYDFNTSAGWGRKDIYAFGEWGKLWSEGFEYYQDEALLILKGKSKVLNENRTLWADDRIRYYRNQNRMEAEGQVKVSQGEKNVFADKMIAYFKDGTFKNILKIEALGRVKIVEGEKSMDADKMVVLFDNGKEINRVEAWGNVLAVTADGAARGDYGLYQPQIAQIELRDNVVITQNGNVIYGQKAITDLSTSVSRILADKESGRRVTGVIKGSTIKGKKHEKK